MEDNTQGDWLSRNSWPKEKTSWVMSIPLGAVIALVLFAVGLSLVAWFMPKFLGFAGSQWVRLLPAISILLISAGGLRSSLSKRRGASHKTRKAFNG